MNTYEKCDNCGADEGLHHWDTKQCPKNGVEEWREGRKQEWEKTTFSIEKSQREKLLAENTEQKQLIKDLVEQLESANLILKMFAYDKDAEMNENLLTKAKAHV